MQVHAQELWLNTHGDEDDLLWWSEDASSIEDIISAGAPNSQAGMSLQNLLMMLPRGLVSAWPLPKVSHPSY
jgi:hypothetical protein